MVAYACNPSTEQAEVRCSCVTGRPRPHSESQVKLGYETLSQKIKNKTMSCRDGLMGKLRI